MKPLKVQCQFGNYIERQAGGVCPVVTLLLSFSSGSSMFSDIRIAQYYTYTYIYVKDLSFQRLFSK